MSHTSDHRSRWNLTRILRRSTPPLLVAFCLVVSVLAGSAHATSPQVAIANVTVSNLNDVKFTVSWTTDVLSNGLVRWGTAPGSLTHIENDPVSSISTHYVTISGLSPNTAYYFEVESGGTVGNNGGVPFSVTTGPTLPPPTPGAFVYGYAYVGPGQTVPAPNAIVFLRIEDNNSAGTPGNSQWLSARTDSTGGWYYTLSGIRTPTAAAYFTFDTGSDNLYYWGEGGVLGRAGVRPTEDVVPVPGSLTQLPNLNFGVVAVTLSDFSADAEPGGVRVSWETASEIDTQGFNLYRATTPGGPRNLVATIPAQAPGSNQGASYDWLDTHVSARVTYYYWLEVVALSGATTLHGPVSATTQGPTAVELLDLVAQPADGSSGALWLLALPAVAAGVAYGLRRRLRR